MSCFTPRAVRLLTFFSAILLLLSVVSKSRKRALSNYVVSRKRDPALASRVDAILERSRLVRETMSASGGNFSTVVKTTARRCDTLLSSSSRKKFSKSQDKEDQFLEDSFFKGVCEGTYVELGGLDGVKFSNTHMFHHGLRWRGVLIEPSPRNFARLTENRPRDELYNAAVCAQHSQVHFIEALNSVSNGASSGVLEFMAPSFVEHWKDRLTATGSTLTKIECMPLSDILLKSDAGRTHVDMLSLDVEGAELEVLRTLDFDKHQFGVIFYEADEHDPVKYASYLGPDALPKGVTLGSIVTKSRPEAPRSCVEAVQYANFRWYDLGGSGSSSKNGVYTEEVLSQLRYRQDVDIARREYETRHRVTFEWIVNPRPDNVFVNPIPILSEVNSAKLYVPSWGHGYDSRSLSEDKRRV
eukprot:29600-Pelagococcus_subviridis.AAC.2